MAQFNRRARLTLTKTGAANSVVIEGLRMSFQVMKTKVPGTLDNAEVSIYNLSQATRNSISDMGYYALLEAGYSETELPLGHLFEGNIVSYSHNYEGADVVTKISFYDGQEVATRDASLSMKKGTKALDILKAMIKKAKTTYDFSLFNEKDFAGLAWPTGFTHDDVLQRGLDTICESMNADWTIEKGVVRVISRDQKSKGVVIELNAQSGLIGTPVRIDDVLTRSGRNPKKEKGHKAVAPGYLVKCLMNPRIKPGTVIRLNSRKLNIDSEAVVITVSHNGDTHGGDWMSDLRVSLL